MYASHLHFQPPPAPARDHTRFLVSCEHGGSRIPPRYRSLFAAHEDLLRSADAHDPGALALARDLSQALGCPLFASTISRLLIDLNRSPGHIALYSKIMHICPPQDRETIYNSHYLPYRRRIEKHVTAAVENGDRLIHIASHSFTPVLDGRPRDADVCFIYDPGSAAEDEFCTRWITALSARAPYLKLRRNYPYTGRADGFCSWLRRRYPHSDYLGIILEVNQRHVATGGPAWRTLRDNIMDALLEATGEASAVESIRSPTQRDLNRSRGAVSSCG